MNIATALNRKYLEYTVVMLCSLCENNNEHIDAYLLHSELTTQDIDIIKNSLSKYDITIISVEINKSDFDDRLPRNTQWSIETYYRLMLMDILPESVDRLMYLDVDLIINGSIEEFYHIDFAGDDVIAADDSNGKRTLDTFGSKQIEMFHDMLAQGFRYFNAGVMLFNVAQIRKTNNFNTYMEAIKNGTMKWKLLTRIFLTMYMDIKLDILTTKNLIFLQESPITKNIHIMMLKNSVKIIHFAGDKPWNNTNCHYDIEQLWWDYALKTPFYYSLLEQLQQNLMSDNTLETIVDDLIKENGELKSKVSSLISINEKLMTMVK